MPQAPGCRVDAAQRAVATLARFVLGRLDLGQQGRDGRTQLMRRIGHEMALAGERGIEAHQQTVDLGDHRLYFLRYIDRYRAQIGLRAIGQLGPQGIERTQPGTHTEPDDRCRNQDQQHFGQQHAEQDVAHQFLALDQGFGSQNGHRLLAEMALIAGQPYRFASQRAIVIPAPFAAHLLPVFKGRHGQFRVAVEQFALRSVHGVENLVELVGEQHRPRLLAERQLQLAVDHPELLGNGEGCVEQAPVVGLGSGSQGHPVGGQRPDQQQPEHRRQQPVDEHQAQTSGAAGQHRPVFRGSNPARARCGW